MKKMIKQKRDFPSIEELLQTKELISIIETLSRPVATDIIRETIKAEKKKFDNLPEGLSHNSLINSIKIDLLVVSKKRIKRIINCTGVVLHTNLGRAPLPENLFNKVKDSTVGYGNVEFDIETGLRGKRGEFCEKLLACLTGAEAGLVVNNCAAALLLILNSLANRKQVVISKGEMVQIGGGFRIQDLLKRSGARLSEVGSTNITSLSDYNEVVDEKTSMLLKVHRSNFVQSGFTDEVSLKELVQFGNKNNLLVINDLGSGVLIPTKKMLGYNEPTVQSSVRDGASLTCFSGDKLLGGMQAGLIVGKRELIEKLKKNPIYRALRVDKILFVALENLLSSYLNGTHLTDIKLWELLSTPVEELSKRAGHILKSVGSHESLSIIKTTTFAGGGALPEKRLPSIAIQFSDSLKPRQLAKEFRSSLIPIVGRIENECFVLDLKAVDQVDDKIITDSIKSVLNSFSG